MIVLDRGRCEERDEHKEEEDGSGNGRDGGEKPAEVQVAPPRISH